MVARPKAKTSSRTRAEPVPEMTSTNRFFEELQARGEEPILKGESGVLRFDLSWGIDRRGGPELERWYVTVADGNVNVSHRGGRADTVVRADRGLFDRITEGTENAMAAQLRGALMVEGDLHLLMTFQRVFPGPPHQSAKPAPISSAEVTARAR